MVEHLVLFDVATKPRPWIVWAIATIAFVGMLLLRKPVREGRISLARGGADEVLTNTIGIIITGIVWAGFVWGYEWQRHAMIRSLAAGQVSVVEGKAHFVRSPETVDRFLWECISVSDREFCYGWKRHTPAFNQLAARGSAIREGMWLRVSYQDGQILRLETVKP